MRLRSQFPFWRPVKVRPLVTCYKMKRIVLCCDGAYLALAFVTWICGRHTRHFQRQYANRLCYQGTWLDSQRWLSSIALHTLDIRHYLDEYELYLNDDMLTRETLSGLKNGEIPIPSNVTRLSQAIKPLSSGGIQQVRDLVLSLCGRHAKLHRGGLLPSWYWQFRVRKIAFTPIHVYCLTNARCNVPGVLGAFHSQLVGWPCFKHSFEDCDRWYWRKTPSRSFLNRVVGGATAAGLSENIRSAVSDSFCVMQMPDLISFVVCFYRYKVSLHTITTGIQIVTVSLKLWYRRWNLPFRLFSRGWGLMTPL